jgi:hypothetical protein
MALQQPRPDRMHGKRAALQLDRMLHVVLPPDDIVIVYANATATHRTPPETSAVTLRPRSHSP